MHSMLYAQTEVFSSQRDTKEVSLYQQMHRSVQTETADIFKRVRKIAKNNYFLRHVCPHGKPRLSLDSFFVKFDILVFFENLSRKLISLRSEKNNGHIT